MKFRGADSDGEGCDGYVCGSFLDFSACWVAGASETRQVVERRLSRLITVTTWPDLMSFAGHVSGSETVFANAA